MKLKYLFGITFFVTILIFSGCEKGGLLKKAKLTGEWELNKIILPTGEVIANSNNTDSSLIFTWVFEKDGGFESSLSVMGNILHSSIGTWEFEDDHLLEITIDYQPPQEYKIQRLKKGELFVEDEDMTKWEFEKL